MKKHLALILLVLTLIPTSIIKAERLSQSFDGRWIICGQWMVAPYRWIKFAYFPWDPMNVWDYQGDPNIGGWDLSTLDGRYAILFAPWVEDGRLISFARMVLTDDCREPPPPAPVPDEICGILVDPYFIPTPPPGVAGGGMGPLFIPFGKEDNPYYWLELHPLGVFVHKQNRYWWGEDVQEGQSLLLRGVKGDFGEVVTELDEYELVDTCGPAPTPTPRPTPTPTPTSTHSFGPLPNDGFDPGRDAGPSFEFPPSVHASSAQDLFYEGQCTWFVAGKRPDVADWIGGRPRHAYLWDDRARAAGVPVDKTPRVGDIAVWEKDCGGASSFGHVAYVTYVSPDGKFIRVAEVNWNRSKPDIKVESCMSFIHLPSSQSERSRKLPALTPTPTQTHPSNGSRNPEVPWWQRVLNFIFSFFGKHK